MKWLLLLTALAAIGIMVTSPVMAYTPPEQSTDNATDIILWHGDSANVSVTSANVTIISANITIVDLETALTNAGEVSASIIATAVATVLGEGLVFLIIAAFVALVFWQRNVFLYLLAVPILTVYGFAFATDSTVGSTGWTLGVTIAILGTFCLFRVVVNEFLPMVKRLRK